jgi:hypothetical protein
MRDIILYNKWYSNLVLYKTTEGLPSLNNSKNTVLHRYEFGRMIIFPEMTNIEQLTSYICGAFA